MNASTRTTTVLLATLMTAALAGCSSDPDTTSTAGGKQSAKPANVDGSKTLSKLSGDEVKALCESQKKASASVSSEEATTKVGCNISGALNSQAGSGSDKEKVAACKSAVSKCIADAKEREITTTETECKSGPAPKCDSVSVDDFAKCVDESIAQLAKLRDATCEEMLTPGDANHASATPTCDAIKTKCPSLFEHDNESTDSSK